MLAVIAYHFGYGWAPGGFLGVDVFFVLSGYLITSLLLGEYGRSGRISLPSFWLRRARRLLPALLLVVLALGIWINLTAMPFEMATRRDDLIWTIFYASNWHFIASGQDYFANYESASPLRHTWSLAIEEQFYIVWPLIVFGLLRLARGRITLLAAASVVAAVASVATMALLWTPEDPSRAYYGTDARAQQLLVGALLAMAMPKIRRVRRATMVAAVLGLVAGVLLLVSFRLVHDSWEAYYRGIGLGVAIATAALVWAVETAPRQSLGRVLSLGPVAWVGRLSYGLYLWHWPIILAVTSPLLVPASLPGHNTALNLTRLGLTVAIATASYYLVEQPIRTGRLPVIRRSGRRFAIAMAGAVAAVTLSSVAATAVDPGAEMRVSVPNCPPFDLCVRSNAGPGAPVVAVIGDSVARSLDVGFVDLAARRGWTYILAANDSCRVTHLLASAAAKWTDRLRTCFERTPSVLAALRATWHPDVVVVADFMETQAVAQTDGRVLGAGSPQAIAALDPALRDLVLAFTRDGAKVVLLELPPQLGSDCARVLNAAEPQCTVPVSRGNASRTAYDQAYRRIASTVPGVSTVSVTEAVCPGGVCTPRPRGVLLRSDGLHYTGSGAIAVMPAFEQAIDASLR